MQVLVSAVVMFLVTNVDDLVVLTLFYGRATGPGGTRTVTLGQFLGFGAIVVVSLVGAAGATLLPEGAVAYLGVIPLVLGVRAGWEAWSERRGDGDDDDDDEHEAILGRVDRAGGVTVLQVAGVTLANGGDNIGVYTPVFANAGWAATAAYAAIFVVLLAAWCAAGARVAAHPTVARALARWGDIVLPVVLVALGISILVAGGAFGW